MRILITGAGGSGAYWLIKHIRENNPEYEIWGTSRTPKLHQPPFGIKLWEMEALDGMSVHRCINSIYPDMIFHFACNPDKGFGNVAGAIQIPAIGTANILESILHIRMEDHYYSPRIINVSSAEVYGDVETCLGPIKESDPKCPLSPYAIGKLAQDNLGALYHKAHGLDIVTLRAFSYINPRHHTLFTSNMAKRIVDIEEGRAAFLEHGDLSSKRCFLDCRDVAEAFFIASQKCKPGEAYNVGGDEVYSMIEILDKMIQKTDASIQLLERKDLLRPADVSYQVPDNTKFRRQTGWKPKIKIDDALEDLLSCYRKGVEK